MLRFLDSSVFIVIEGLPGCKTTELARALAPPFGGAAWNDACSARLPDRHRAAEYDFDGSPMARHLADAAVTAKLSDVIHGFLADGQAVVLDRYWPSLTAHHRANGSPLWLLEVADQIVAPDITIHLFAPLEVRRQRIAQSPGGGSEADRRTLEPALADALDASLTEQMSRDLAGEVIRVESIEPPEVLAAALVERFEARMPARWKHCARCGHSQDRCRCRQ